MRKAGAILVCLLLLLSVGVAYNQCAGKPCGQANCPSPCPGNCSVSSATCSNCPVAHATCSKKGSCVNCDGVSCSTKDCSKVATLAGTVRYVRSTNDAVKVLNGDKGVLLRVYSRSKQASDLEAKLAALAKGDAITAKFWTCPKSGRHYLVSITGGATTAESTATTPTSCPSSGGCGGCGGQ